MPYPLPPLPPGPAGPPHCSEPPGDPGPSAKPGWAPGGSISEAAPCASHSTPYSWAMSDRVASFSSGGGASMERHLLSRLSLQTIYTSKSSITSMRRAHHISNCCSWARSGHGQLLLCKGRWSLCDLLQISTSHRTDSWCFRNIDLVCMQSLACRSRLPHLMRFSLTRHLRHVRSELASAMYSLPYLPASWALMTMSSGKSWY